MRCKIKLIDRAKITGFGGGGYFVLFGKSLRQPHIGHIDNCEMCMECNRQNVWNVCRLVQRKKYCW